LARFAGGAETSSPASDSVEAVDVLAAAAAAAAINALELALLPRFAPGVIFAVFKPLDPAADFDDLDPLAGVLFADFPRDVTGEAISSSANRLGLIFRPLLLTISG